MSKELKIGLPETMWNGQYSLSANNELTLYLESGKLKDKITIPLPKPQGMWIMKYTTDKEFVLLDV